jgi:hypothetical protein
MLLLTTFYHCGPTPNFVCMQDLGDPMSISGVPGMAHRGMGGFSGFVSCLVFKYSILF